MIRARIVFIELTIRIFREYALASILCAVSLTGFILFIFTIPRLVVLTLSWADSRLDSIFYSQELVLLAFYTISKTQSSNLYSLQQLI